MASVQDAQVQAIQALARLSAVITRPSPGVRPDRLPTSAASHILACLARALAPLISASTAGIDDEGLKRAPGLSSGAAEYAIAKQAAQVFAENLALEPSTWPWLCTNTHFGLHVCAAWWRVTKQHTHCGHCCKIGTSYHCCVANGVVQVAIILA